MIMMIIIMVVFLHPNVPYLNSVEQQTSMLRLDGRWDDGLDLFLGKSGCV